MKSSDAKASKCYLKISSLMIIFIKLLYLSSVILSEITELKYTSLIKIIIKEEICKWHLEAFASELFIYIYTVYQDQINKCYNAFIHDF